MDEEDDIGDGIVDGEYDLQSRVSTALIPLLVNRATDHRGKDTLEDGAENVEDITEEPHDDELYRESFGTAALEVLEDLRGEDDD